MLQSSEVHTLGGRGCLLFFQFVMGGGVVLLFVVVRDQTQGFGRGMLVIACLCAFICQLAPWKEEEKWLLRS